MTIIENITNIKGDTYTLYQTGRSFLSVVNYVERSNKRGTMPAETVERKHRTLSNAQGSNQLRMFKGPMIGEDI